MRKYVMVTIEDHGPKLSESDICKLESRIGAVLTEQHRRFLLEFNGGSPTPDVVDVEGLEGGCASVRVFLGIDRESEVECIEWNLTTLVERLPERLIPIARDSSGNVYCISLRQHDRGAILYCDLQSVYADFEHDPEFYPVAPDFDTFLSKLYEFPG
jgi:hypothetical protein